LTNGCFEVINCNSSLTKNQVHVNTIIDIGPEGGRGGGKIVATGTPEKVADNKKSITGEYLKEEWRGKPQRA
jgi:excinuclease UvrABC ATPase subunit